MIMALCLPVSEWQSKTTASEIRYLNFDHCCYTRQWFLVLQYLCKHLYLLICISGFWSYSTCTVQASLLAGPVICISGFWFYSACASTSACRYASVVSGSTVLVQTLLLADQHQWFLVLQYLGKHLYLLMYISGFWFYNTWASTSACWCASVVSGSTVFAQVHDLLQYLCRHFYLLMSMVSGVWFCSTCASTSACWSESKAPLPARQHQWFLVLQCLCKCLCLLISFSGFWLDYSICADTFACWWAAVVSGSAVLVQAPLLAQ